MDKLIAKAMRGMKIMIAIKGMDMPANCGECPLTYPVGFYRNLPFSVDKSKGCCILICEIKDPILLELAKEEGIEVKEFPKEVLEVLEVLKESEEREQILN